MFALTPAAKASWKERARSQWPPYRRKLAVFVEDKRFDLLIAVVLLLDVATLVAEVHYSAVCRTHAPKTKSSQFCVGMEFAVSNSLMVLFYAIEVSVRLATYRCFFFRSKWNNFDLALVFFGIVDLCLLPPALGKGGDWTLLRTFRVARMARAFRLLAINPNLLKLLQMLWASLASLFWGFCLLIFMILLWSVISVEFIGPKAQDLDFGPDAEHCKVMWNSLWQATIFSFKLLVLSQDWGPCADMLTESMPYTAVLLIFASTIVQLGLLNLILSSILDSAAASREKDRESRANQARQKARDLLEEWRVIFQMLTEDGNDAVSIAELKAGIATEKQIRYYMESLDISEDDLGRFFELMDIDGSGELDYNEFVDTIAKAQSQDPRVYNMTIKLTVDHVMQAVRKQSRELHIIREQLCRPSEKPRVARRLMDSEAPEIPEAADEFEHVPSSVNNSTYMQLFKTGAPKNVCLGGNNNSTHIMRVPEQPPALLSEDASIVSKAVVGVPAQPPALLSEDGFGSHAAAAAKAQNSNWRANFMARGNHAAAQLCVAPTLTDKQPANMCTLEERLRTTGASLSRSIEEVASVLSQQMELLQDLQNRVGGPLRSLSVSAPAMPTTPRDVTVPPSSDYKSKAGVVAASKRTPKRWCHRFLNLSDQPLATASAELSKARQLSYQAASPGQR